MEKKNENKSELSLPFTTLILSQILWYKVYRTYNWSIRVYSLCKPSFQNLLYPAIC